MTDARTTPTQRSAPGRQAPKGSPGARAGWSDVAPAQDSGRIDVRLTAAILAVMNDEPVVAVLPPPNSTFQPDKPMAAAVPNALALESLPSEKFVPGGQGTLETGLRACVTRVTPLDIGYLEQLYTFADRATTDADVAPAAAISIGYLALAQARPDANGKSSQIGWQSCYRYFPWEDWRKGKPGVLAELIEPRLMAWAAEEAADSETADLETGLSRGDRLTICFGLYGGGWDEERVLERYDVMLAAGLVDEAFGVAATPKRDGIARTFGVALAHDHRRVLATALGRLRAKIKYRPVVFEMMPDEFTLFELQRAVEAILGPHLHKQNFRRLVENMGLVEPTGVVKTHTGGRPAKLFRFRRDVLLERPSPGVRVRAGRG